MASGSLLTKIHKSYGEAVKLGLAPATPYRIHGAQAAGCSPISTAQKAGLDFFKPVKPNTIAKSLAIGTPADGFYALRVMKDTGGQAEDVSDDQIREGIQLLAECEGIFAETAGGVTVGVARKLIASGAIPAGDSAVLCITGNGLKTVDAVAGHAGFTREIKPSLGEFQSLLGDGEMANA
jgi:threonine synthase